MDCQDARLLRHLTLAVIIKLVVLGALWWAFVREGAVSAGSEQTAAHVLAPWSPSITLPPTEQEPAP